MRVRAYDSKTERYFKSEVYAIVGKGISTRHLVLVPGEVGNYLKLLSLVNIIKPERPVEWIRKSDASLVDSNALHTGKEIKLDFFAGYPWVLEEPYILAKLLQGEEVIAEESNLSILDTRLPDWCYVETQEDVDALMHETHGFHDSVLKNLEYVSGAYVSEDKSMYPVNSLRALKMTFESQWTETIELVFEGLVALNLRPSDDNFDAIIFSASILLKDETVFFVDDEMEKENLQTDCTCVKAYSLRWRILKCTAVQKR